MWLFVLATLTRLGYSQLSIPFNKGPWCFPEPANVEGCTPTANTKAQFYYGVIERNGTQIMWLDFEVFEPRWMGVGFADSTIGTRGQMIGVHAYIDGIFGANPATLEEWQLGNHSLYLRHPGQSFQNLIRFQFAPGKRSIRFERLVNSPDRWDYPVSFAGELCFIWAIGKDMNVAAHDPALKGQTCATFTTPTSSPTLRPTYQPTEQVPSKAPTAKPSASPTKKNSPTRAPTLPTNRPSISPTISPSKAPTKRPVPPPGTPTKEPTVTPTFNPTRRVTRRPTVGPLPADVTRSPTTTTTNVPTASPTKSPLAEIVVVTPETTLPGNSLNQSSSSGLPGWIIPLIVAGAVLCCCMICAGVYLHLRRRKDLEEQRTTREEARKQAKKRLEAAKRREEQEIDELIKPIDIGFVEDDTKKDDDLDDPLLKPNTGGYYGPPSSRRGGGGGLQQASRLHARPMKKSKFSTFGDDDDF